MYGRTALGTVPYGATRFVAVSGAASARTASLAGLFPGYVTETGTRQAAVVGPEYLSETVSATTGGGTVSLLSRSLAALRSAVGFSGRTTLSSHTLATQSSVVGVSAKTGLAAHSTVQTRSGATFSGKLSLAARSLSASFGKMVPPGSIALLARSMATASMRVSQSARTSLTVRAASQNKASAMSSGRASLAAKSIVASFGRIVPPGSVALLARSFAKVFMRGPVHGTTMLTVKSTAQSKSSAKLVGHVGLAAFSKTTSQIASRVTAVLYLPISGASSFSASFARSTLPNLIAVVTDLARKIAGKYGIAAIQGKYGITNITGSSMTATADAISDFVCGDTWEISATLYNASGSPLDLTGAQSIVWTLDDISASTNVLTLSLNSGISLSGQPTSGQVLIKPTPTQTASLIPMTSYRQQCTVVLADGTKTTQFIGAITPLPSNK